MSEKLNEALLWLAQHQGRITFSGGAAPVIRIQAMSDEEGDDKTLKMLSRSTVINSGRAIEALLAAVQAIRKKA